MSKAKTWAQWISGGALVCLVTVSYGVARFRLAEADMDHNHGLVLLSQGCYSEAIQQFQDEARIVPYSGAYDCWGLALEKQGHVTEAIALYHKALTLDPNNSHTHDNLACALEDQGHLQQSLTEHQVAVRVGSDDAVAHRHLGDALHRQGAEQQAQDEWQNAANLGDAEAVSILNKQSLR